MMLEEAQARLKKEKITTQTELGQLFPVVERPRFRWGQARCWRQVYGYAGGWGEVFPDVKYQRCTVHFYRNVFSVTPRSKVKLVAKMLKAIHAQENKNALGIKQKPSFKNFAP